MEKFTVDLDKVLDELEFNEDRAENLLTSSRRHNPSVSSSERDAVSFNSPSHVPFESGDPGSKWRPKPLPLTQKTSVSGVFSSLNEYLNSGSALTPSTDESGDGGNDRCLQMSDPDLQSRHSGPSQDVEAETYSQQEDHISKPMRNLPAQLCEVSSVEEKPVLIGSDVLQSGSLLPCTSNDNEDRSECSAGPLLLDIATTGTHTYPAASEEIKSPMDLLSHGTNASVESMLDMERADTLSLTLTIEETPKHTVSFGSLDINEELDDDDLNEFLSDLEQEEEEELKKQSSSCEHYLENGSSHPSTVESLDGSQNETSSCVSLKSIDLSNTEVSPKFVGTQSSEIVPEKSSFMGKDSFDIDSHTCLVSKLSMEAEEEVSDEESPHDSVEQNIYSSRSNQCVEVLASDLEVCSSQDMIDEPRTPDELPPEEVTDCPKEARNFLKNPDIGFQNLPFAENRCVSTGNASEAGTSSVTSPSLAYFETPEQKTVSQSNSDTIAKTAQDKDDFSEVQDNCIEDKLEQNCSLGYVAPELHQAIDIPLPLVKEQSEMLLNSHSPPTPPTVPATPTGQDPPPAMEEQVSSISESSTPFLTPTAVFSDSSEFQEDTSYVAAVSCESSISVPSADSDLSHDASASSDSSQKPVRPSSLEIPVRTEPAQPEVACSSEDSPTAMGEVVIGRPGATPCANKPSMANSLGEVQVTDESTTESSIDEGACGAVADEEPSATLSTDESRLGKEPPFWVPDADAPCCMLCDFKFTVIKRRHHCRACGKVLCSKCCNEKAHLEYINAEARVCVSCKSILLKADSISPSSPLGINTQPNPNNPMTYCSTVSPLLQAAGSSHHATPTVMVPVGVLKREGSSKPKSEAKQVMFSDGIRPGADLAELDGSSEPRLPIRRPGRISKRVGTPPGNASSSQRTLPSVDGTTLSYVPHGVGLPPIVIRGKDGIQFEEDPDPVRLMNIMQDDSAHPVKFTINRNLYVLVKILNLDCCVNRVCWCFTSDGLSAVGQDEIVIILEVEPSETCVPKDIFIHLNSLYMEAAKGNTVTEMGHTLTQGSLFLGSKEHGGFLYVRPTFQCLHRLILPPAPYLVGVLIHKWETPWARVFPIRLMLRLGAEFRYYPCPLVSIRQRPSVYGEIGHTIIQVLADFRNMVYTLPTVRGLLIHMEDKQTTILLPRNRYDQVMRALNNSNDHVLAFGANFSQDADSHLVCMQSDTDHSYHTQAINIHNKPRKVTGASFVVFNGALKVSCGMAAKSTIVEDGLMVKVTSETMASLKTALRDMKDLSITCGPINAPSERVNAGAGVSPSDEIVLIKWASDDRSFNIGVLSYVDGRPLDGVPSIRVHNGTDYHGEYRFIRWTEVFILESEEGSGRTGDPVDISRLSEQLAKATCLALVKLLDLLAAANLTTLAVRATIHSENVGYLAGSNGEKLPPIYMNSLDDELVPVLHEAGLMSGESPAVLELVFRIMESG